MTVDLNELARQDEAAAQAARDKPSEKPEPLTGLQVFMVDLGTGPVPVSSLHAAVQAADLLGPRVGPLYGQVRDAVVEFTSDYQPGRVSNAIARLCVPLVGYARMMSGLNYAAHNAQQHADRGTKPATLNFADIHALGLHTTGAFTQALKEADPHAHVLYINFVTGSVSEAELEAELSRHVRGSGAKVLIEAATTLKDGMRATHRAMSAGARSTDDLIPPPAALQPRTSKRGHGVHLTDNGDGTYVPTEAET